MTQLTFSVNNQVLTRTDTHKIVGDTIGQFEAVFTFNSWWNGYNATAQFTKNGRTYNCVLTNNTCTIPHEVLTGGVFYVNVFSTNGNGDRKTANEVAVFVMASGFKTGGISSAQPTPSVYQQLLNEIAKKDETLVINATGTNNHIVLDKTYLQIVTALGQGRNAIIVRQEPIIAYTIPIVYYFTAISENISFTAVWCDKQSQQTENNVWVKTIAVKSNNTVEYAHRLFGDVQPQQLEVNFVDLGSRIDCNSTYSAVKNALDTRLPIVANYMSGSNKFQLTSVSLCQNGDITFCWCGIESNNTVRFLQLTYSSNNSITKIMR